MSRLILLLLVAVLFCTCAKAREKYYYPDHKFDRTPLGDTIDRASMNLLKEAYKAADDKNIVASPLGVFTLLSMYCSGAGTQSKEEIVRVLGAGNCTQLSDSYRQLESWLSNIDSRFFTLANKMYLDQRYTLQPLFEGLARSRGELEKIDFSDPPAATATINRWGEEKTRGYIKNPVPDDAITKDTVAALFNVIFFQDHWGVPFHSNETKDENFHLDKTTTVKKPTMHLQEPLFYYESKDIGAKLIELPYRERGFRMIVVLPNELDGLSATIDNVQRQGLLADVFKLKPVNAVVNLYLPKFDIKNDHNLNDLLPKIGINKIFTESADGIVKEDRVVVSKAFQKAFVKVDEEGATAGAFTGQIMIAVSYPPRIPEPIEVRVDHPFLFAICYEDKILFVGTVSH